MDRSITQEEFERRIAACHPSVRAVYDYWRTKRGNRLMPSRKEIDPADLKPCLPSIILLDVVPDARRFVYRLVGTKEVAERGYDPTGRPVSEAFFAKTAEETLNLTSCASARLFASGIPTRLRTARPNTKTSSTCRFPATAPMSI
jgi:hypothetical protein